MRSAILPSGLVVLLDEAHGGNRSEFIRRAVEHKLQRECEVVDR